jgi:hypothetical protein
MEQVREKGKGKGKRGKGELRPLLGVLGMRLLRYWLERDMG